MGYLPRESGGNATVPNDALIQPAQAFVDCAAIWFANTATTHSNLSNGIITFTSKGITSFSTSLLDGIFTYSSAMPELHLQGNALSAGNVNAILSWYVSQGTFSATNAQELDLSGGTNAAPTGQGIVDKATLIGNGWTVTTN
jgi:hypothetical protein